MTTSISTVGYLLTAPTTTSILSTIYPDGNIKLIGYCYDSLGSRSQSQVTLTISSLHDIQTIIKQMSIYIPNVLNEDNAVETLSLVNAFALELNYTYPNQNVVLSQKQTLLNLVTQAKAYADQAYQRDADKNSLYIYEAVIGSMETLVRNPVSYSLITTIVNLFNSIDYTRLGLKQKYNFINNDGISGNSPQNVFRTTELYNMASSMSNIVDCVSLFTNSSDFSSQIFSMITNINIVLSLGSAVTQQSRELNLTSLSMISYKNLVTNLENTKIVLGGGNNVSIPAGLSNSIENSQVSVLAALVNSNPFNDGNVVLNQYIVIELKDATTDNVISVTDLDQPFEISFNISRSTLQNMNNLINAQQGYTVNIWPDCSHWVENSSV